VNFLTWLFDELDWPSNVSRFAKIVYDDINNGCGDRKFGPVEWRDHFIAEHPDSAESLNSMLSWYFTMFMTL
jgi:hypothetical protein